MQTQVNIKGDVYIIDTEECQDLLARFVAAVSTGGIKINYVQTMYPDNELFKNTEERDWKHGYEVLQKTNPKFCSVQPLKQKTKFLLKLEEKAEKAKTASNKEAA